MSVKYYYFDGRGIGEPIRMIMAYGEIDFEDIRIPYDKFPPNLPADIKQKCRWGQVPMIEFEGKALYQSLAIARYFAKKANLVPTDSYEAALCDEYVDTVKDFMMQWYTGVVFETDPKLKEQKLQDVQKATNEKFLNVFEGLIKSNDGKHLVGNSLTWADIYLANALLHFELLIGVKLATGFTALSNLVENVSNTPSIKKWLENRPVTKY